MAPPPTELHVENKRLNIYSTSLRSSLVRQHSSTSRMSNTAEIFYVEKLLHPFMRATGLMDGFCAVMIRRQDGIMVELIRLPVDSDKSFT